MENLTRLFSTMVERKVIAALIILLIGCVIMPLKELRYTLWGKSAAATLISVTPEKRPEQVSAHLKRVAYQFDDNGTTRNESDRVTTNWPIPGFDRIGMAPPNTTITIEYVPGSTSSRLTGHDNKSWYIISSIVAAIAILAAALWWKFRDASQYRSHGIDAP